MMIFHKVPFEDATAPARLGSIDLHCFKHVPNALIAASAKSLSVDPFSLVTKCTVIWPLKVIDMNKCSTISQLKSPIESPAKSKSYPKYGRFDKSMITSTSLPFTRAEPLPMRLQPALFPNASFKHWPIVIATSSVV
ncbi:unnamed protein product [Bathycoccus prasinos]